MNTHEIQSTSMADLRAAYFQGKLTYGKVERERLRRVEEQANIRLHERKFGEHPMRNECCPIKFAEGLPRR